MIEKIYQDSLSRLRELLRIPTVLAQGKGVPEGPRFVAGLLAELGAKVEIIEGPGAPVVSGFLDAGRPKTLILYNHYDVQPPEPLELWETPPFEPSERDGRLFARGAADDKGEFMARWGGVRLLQALGEKLPVNLRFTVEGEEEIGSLHFKEFAGLHPEIVRGDACLWESGTIDLSGRHHVPLGVKGICYMELVAKGANRDLHSSIATSVVNPAWRLVWALASLKDAGERILVPDHAAEVEPSGPDLLKLVDAMPDDEEGRLRTLGLADYLLGLRGTARRRRDFLDPTITICGLWSGYQGPGSKTVLPSEARAKLDFRLVPRMDPKKVAERVRRRLDEGGFTDVEIAWYDGYPAARTPPSHPFVKSVAAGVRGVTGDEPILTPNFLGSGPMHVFGKTPCVAWGITREDARIHAPNEWIFLADLRQGIEISAGIVRSCRDL